MRNKITSSNKTLVINTGYGESNTRNLVYSLNIEAKSLVSVIQVLIS